jgi:hypothetical protein
LHALVLVAVLAAVFPRVFFLGEVLTPGSLLFAVPPWKGHVEENWRDTMPPGKPRPRYFLNSDVITAFHPFYTIASDTARGGEWPLWNNRQLMGAPLMANYQSAVFYPPRVLQYLLDVVWGTTLFILLKLWLCGMTAYLCGRGLKLGLGAARFLSVAWMLNGYNLHWAYWPLPDVSAWLPLLLLGAEWLLQGRVRAGTGVLAAGGALIMLAGHPETAFGMALGVVLYFGLRLVLAAGRGEPFLRPLGGFVLGWAIALLLSAIQWLPFLEYMLHSYELHTRKPTNMVSALPAAAVVQFFVPRFFGIESDYTYWGAADSNRYAIHPGAVVWLGVVLLAATWRELGPVRRQMACLGVVALLQLLIVFDAPTISRLHELPGLTSLRQNYHIGFPLLVLAYAGACGLEAWLRRSRPWRDLLYPLALVAVVALLIAGLLRFYGNLPAQMGVADYVWRQIGYAAAVGVLGMGLLALHIATRRPRLVLALLGVLLAADLTWAARHVHPAMPRELAYFDTPLTDYLLAKGRPCRIDVRSATIPEGVITAFGIEEWLGYDGITPLRTLRLLKGLGDDLWNSFEPVMSVQYYLHNPAFDDDPRAQEGPFQAEPLFPRDNPDYFTLEATIDGIEIYRNRKAFPRAFLAGHVEVEPDFERLTARLRDPDFDPAATVLTPWAGAHSLPDAPLPEDAHATVLAYNVNEVTIGVSSSQQAALVLADAYFPGWNAYVGGEHTEIFPAYDIFRGVVVPPGEHEVIFRYEPWAFQAGRAISFLALIGVALLGVFGRMHQRQAAQE